MAALSVDKVYRFVQLVSNKESRGWISPEELNIAAEVAQLTYYSELEGVYSATKKIGAELRPFEHTSTAISNGDSIDGFRILISSYISSGEANEFSEIREIDQEEVPNVLGSSIIAPSATRPIIYFENDSGSTKVKLSPDTIVCTLKYLKSPTAPEWAYSTTSGRPSYESGSSTDFGFDESAFIEISRRILEHIGLNIGREELLQYSQMNKGK